MRRAATPDDLRAIDERVGVEVFGFQKIKMPAGDLCWAGIGLNGRFPVYASCCFQGLLGTDCWHDSLPHFSTNYNAAFQIIDKLKSRKQKPSAHDFAWPVEINWIDEDNAWSVSFIMQNGESGEVLAQTLPLAICLAALQAVQE